MSRFADSHLGSHNGDSHDQSTLGWRPQASSESQEGRGSTKKRRRVAVACRSCSSRKSRCNGERPKCSSCQEMGVECNYQQPLEQAPKQKTTSPDLDLLSRLQVVEASLKTIQESSTMSQRQHPVQRDNDIQILTERNIYDSQHANTTSSLSGNGPLDGPIVPSETEEDDVDGMAAIVLADEKEEIGFFGASSNITLFKRITQAVAQNVSSTSFTATQQFFSSRISIRSPTTSKVYGTRDDGIRVNFYTVPAFAEGLALIQQFFATVAMLLPCFNEAHVLESYREAAQINFRGVRRPWLAILNMMFAFSTTVSSTSSPLQKYAEESDTYYQRAMGLATQDVLDTSSLETVQLSLLFSTYLMSTQRSMKTWNFHALAVNGALKLGLHSPQASSALPLSERELRKRVWFFCVTNDRYLSMLFGRAPMIHDTLVKMDLPVDIKDRSLSPNVSATLMASMIDQYRAYIEIHKLMGVAVGKLYNQNWGPDLALTTHELLACNLDVSWKLAEFRHNLPLSTRIITSLELQQNSLQPLAPLRLRIFLTLRYLNVQILILRPILFKFLDYKFDSEYAEHELGLLQGSGFCVLQECSSACKEAISLIGTILHPDKIYETTTLHGAWWFNTYYVFNASLVLFGILLVRKMSTFQDLFTASSVVNIRSSLEQAEDVLKCLDNGNSVVTRSRDCLSRLIRIYDSMDIPPAANLSTENTLSAFTRNAEQAAIQDANLFPSMQGINISNDDIGIEFSDLGGLIMNSDYEFINNYYQILR